MTSTIAAFWFAAPLMLLGAAAIAAPIIAHLMNRRARQRIVFPTIRWLVESTSSQSRLYRIRRWLLLALRCLAVLFVVAAFAQPGCSSRDRVLGADDGGASIVYVLDTSASLGRVTDSGNLLDAMRATVSRSLSELKRGTDRVNIVIAEAKPQVVFPASSETDRLTANLDAVRQELAALEVSSDRADLHAAIAQASQLLENASGIRRVVVVSDMQRRNWDGFLLGASGQSLLPKDVQLQVVPLVSSASSTTGNVALHAPRCDPARTLSNRPANLLVKVANFTAVKRDVTVSATVDGQAIGTESIQLAAGETRELAFEHVFTQDGLHRVEFNIPEDALAIDNQALLTVETASRVKVFVVGDDNATSLGSSSYFLMRALAPRGDDRDLVEVSHITSADIVAANLDAAAAVILSDVGVLAADAVKELREYMNAGGGLIWFAGGDAVSQNIERFKSEAGNSIAPLLLGQREDVGAVGEPARIGEGQWNAPALADFDPQSQALLQRIRFATIHEVRSVGEGAKVLLRFVGERPAMALQTVGDGRFVLANFSPSLEAGDLGKYGSFPALMHSLMRYVQPQRDWRFAATAGESLAMTLPIPVGEPTGRIVLQGPGDALLNPSVSRDAQRVFIDLPRTRNTGFHGIFRNDVKQADMAVNVDWRESDLTPIDDETLKASLASNGTDVAIANAADDADASPLRGRDIWHWFVAGAMLMIGLELALLAVWRR